MRLSSSTLDNLIILAENCHKVKGLAAKYGNKVGTSSSTPDIRNLVDVDVTSDADVDSDDSADELDEEEFDDSEEEEEEEFILELSDNES